MQPEAHSDFAMDQTWPPVASSALNPNTTPQRKLKIYAIRSSLSVSLRIRFGMVGCDVLRNTSKDFAVVDGIAAMAENAGALCDVFWAPWHPRHVASANCFPAAGSPTSWPNAMAMLARRSGALHADQRTDSITLPFGANVFTTAQDRVCFGTRAGPPTKSRLAL